MDTIPTTNGSTSHDGSTPPPGEASTSTSASSFDPSVFRSYLLALLPPVIGASPSDLESLFDDEFDARVTRFASEAGGVLYVVKTKEDLEGEPIGGALFL
jgi:dynein heavy chain 1